MRVIAGQARSIPLEAPEDKVRPTTDRTKETVFNIIAKHIPGAYVLDLFAGSGALGIEALSRGAQQCDFVDIYNESIRCIKNNLEKTKLIENAQILKYDYNKACIELGLMHKKYDIIFLDPPYSMGLEVASLKLIQTNQLLSEHGIIIIESHSETSVGMDEVSELEIYKVKEYKTNKFIFIQRRGGME
jgi:16S rRNA (guanine966-N2)-methyltransferase